MIRRHTQSKPKPRPQASGAPNGSARAHDGKRGQAVGRKQLRVGAQASTFGRRRLAWLRAHWLSVTAAALLLAGVGAGAAIWQAPALRVRDVEVVGAVSTRERDIISRIDFWEERMLTVNLSGAADAIAELPLVASVNIERRWPDTVRITVREREPWGSWEQAGLRYTIDREGYVLGRGAPPAGSTTIISNESFSLQAGDRVDAQAVDAAAGITRQIEQALGTRAVELTYSPDEGIRVRTADGQTALLGDSSGIAYKLAVWARVAEEAAAREISYATIDLRFGDRPVLR